MSLNFIYGIIKKAEKDYTLMRAQDRWINFNFVSNVVVGDLFAEVRIPIEFVNNENIDAYDERISEILNMLNSGELTAKNLEKELGLEFKDCAAIVMHTKIQRNVTGRYTSLID